MIIEQSKQSKFQRWFDKFFRKEEKPAVKVKAKLRPWQQGGGYGFGKPAWMRSQALKNRFRVERVAEGIKAS